MNELRSRLVALHTDDLTRHSQTQVRAACDNALVAEYAQAMIEGAEFPPVVVFEDEEGWRFLADGHHRVDATALAAERDPTRDAMIRAELRRGGLDDAIRYAMRANRAHGKRLNERDFAHAYNVAVERNLIQAAHAKDVVPAVVELMGCSIRTAQLLSKPLRRDMAAKRDRLILHMHRQGRTQEAIAAELDVGQATVSEVIERAIGNRSNAETDKPQPPPRSRPEKQEAPAPVIPPGQRDPTDPPRFKIDTSPFLPLLKQLEPEQEEPIESGAVGLGDGETNGEQPVVVDADTATACQRIEAAIDCLLDALDQLPAVDRRTPNASSAMRKVSAGKDYLFDLLTYLKG